MLIQSKKYDEKFIWIKVPKTGTRAYSQLFHPNGDEFFVGNKKLYHIHKPFSVLYTQHEKKYSGFTVLRDPRTRFISALKHLADLNQQCDTNNCINHPGKMPLNNMDDLVNFLYDNFERNCIPKNNKDFKEIFGVEFINYYDSFFKTQTFWAYHPKVKYFKYEKIEEFNDWLYNSLGIDVAKLQKVGTIKTNHLEHLNFEDVLFKQVVRHLFYDDYQVFDYQEEI
jgi:hypothetical protein